nr:MAG TPA: Rep protein [Cressdnaviricota sp.]
MESEQLEDLEGSWYVDSWRQHADSLGPTSLSAPPVESPEFEDLPAIPARLPHRDPGAPGRLRGKAFFLTYSQSALERAAVIEWFQRQRNVKRFIVGREHHQDGNLHWHVAIEFQQTKDVRRPQYFDINGEHPNCGIWSPRNERNQTYEEWFHHHWHYCKKEDPTPHIVGEEPGDGRKKKRNEIFTGAIKLAREQDVKAGMEFLEKHAPYDVLTKYEQIQRALTRLRTLSHMAQAPARPLSEFTHQPLLDPNWHCLFLTGPTNLGKTQYARALLPEATVVSHRDQLRDVDFSKGVIFDDFDVGHWPPTAVIHLLDWEEPRGLDVRYTHVMIPPHTRKIFTHNRDFERWISPDITVEQEAATRRRIDVVKIHRKLFD